MKRALILAVGRQKDADFRRLCEDYYRRCSRRFRVEERELKDVRALKQAVPHRDAVVVALDEHGGQHTSRAFARLLGGWLDRPITTVVFLIGGADGLDDELRSRADHQLSLGSMTFAHRLVRLVLAEQLYRAVSILEGAPYHRG